ncbi:type VI secretion system contractile sheath small subunit [Paraburkholderia sp. JPY303]|uniref:type VI secretion system contractile sheath small subunit n=1 Tax=Paraburkholderia atlantica TaxID=2654982 RepID=UPI000A02FD8E|nr:type VI secretion system contractile sheath small subunit [Paraburkholderia atlantica]
MEPVASLISRSEIQHQAVCENDGFFSEALEANPGPDAQLTVNLEFESIHDFSPDAVVQKVPELCQMIALRDALKALKGPLGNNPHFRKRVQALIVDEKARRRLMGELGIENKRPESNGKTTGVTHE